MKPQTGYSLAQKIYNIEKYPPTAKIYGWTKILEEKGYIKKENGLFVSDVTPLIDELNNILNSNQLNLDTGYLIMLEQLLDSKSFRGYVKVVLTINRVRNNGINFLESVLMHLMLVCKFVQDVGDDLKRKDSMTLYEKIVKKKYNSRISRGSASKWYELYQYFVIHIDDMDIDFQKDLNFKFEKIDKFWDVIKKRYHEDVKMAVDVGGMKTVDFMKDYTKSSKVSLMAWLLPNDILDTISSLYSLGTIFDIKHILGDRYR